jgi:hypothetical protein
MSPEAGWEQHDRGQPILKRMTLVLVTGLLMKRQSLVYSSRIHWTVSSGKEKMRYLAKFPTLLFFQLDEIGLATEPVPNFIF